MTKKAVLALPQDRPFEILGLGECMVELWAEEPLGRASVLKRAYGGDILNTLVMAARLGSNVGFISKVGDDPFGKFLLEQWKCEGIDLTCCPLVSGTNGVYFISLLPGGEREFSYRRRGSAASTFTPHELEQSYIASTKVLLLSGITQAISQTAQAATLKAAGLAKEVGVLVAYDPNYRPALWTDRSEGAEEESTTALDIARSAFDDLLSLVDILLPSFPADALLLGEDLTTPKQLAEACSNRGPTVISIKAGAEGCYLHYENKTVHVPAEPNPTIRDATGAGDAWNAAFLHAMFHNKTLTEAAQWANRIAAWKLGHRGAVPQVAPDLKEFSS